MIAFALILIATYARKVSLDNEQTLNHEKHQDHHHKFSIFVPGSGSIDLLPSIGTVVFAIEIQDTDAKSALQKANELVDSAVQSIKYTLRSDDHQIETGIFQLSLRYDYSTGIQQLVGYSVTNQLYITTKDLSIIGKIITVGIDAGLNRIDGVNYSNNAKEIQEATDEALKLAIKDAERKAKVIAHQLDKKVVEILKFQFIDSYDNSGSPPREYAPTAAAGTAKADIPTPVFASKSHVRADIQLKVRLE